jgi:glycosyltransferase involved in cell wall biosynthesis
VASETFPGATVIIPVKNEERTIADTIESVLNIDYPNYKVIVVDGGSTDRTVHIAREYPVKVIQVEDSTPGQGRNLGIRNSSGEIIAFIDGDCRAARAWLKNAVALLREDSIGGVGGPAMPHSEAKYLSKALLNVMSTFFASAGSTLFRRYKKQKEVNNVPSCNAVYRREVLEKAGLYSEQLRFCEDVDLNYRIRAKGYRIVYSPNVTVEHDWKGFSLGSVFRLMLKYGAGRAIAAKKCRHLFSLSYSVPSIALLCALSLLLLSLSYDGVFLFVLEFLVLSYLALALASASLAACRFKDLKMVPLATVTYVLAHVGYATGFILGAVRRHS